MSIFLTEKLLILCDILNVNLDYLLRDISDTPHEDKKQEQPLLGFNKPGGSYSVLVISISDEVVIAQDMKGNKHIIKMSDVLFIKECHGSILKSLWKASKINGLMLQSGTYYTTTTPFFDKSLEWQNYR